MERTDRQKDNREFGIESDRTGVEPTPPIDDRGGLDDGEGSTSSVVRKDVLHLDLDTLHTEAEPMPRPEEVMLVFRDYCVRWKGAACDRCQLACPVGAISYSAAGIPVIDAASCTGCGCCFGICDAFSSSYTTASDLRDRIERIASKGDRVYITCRENVFPGLDVAGNVVVLSCLACIPPELWTLLLAEDIDLSIACDLRYCEDCSVAGRMGPLLYNHAIEAAQEWTGGEVGFSPEIPEKHDLLDWSTDQAGIGRRDLFCNLASDVGDVASGKHRLQKSGVLEDFYSRREQMHATARALFAEEGPTDRCTPVDGSRKLLFPRLGFLQEACKKRPGIAEHVPINISHTELDRCTNSLLCVSACPTGARTVTDDRRLVFDGRYCVGCGICVDTCPSGACSVVSTSAAAYERGPVVSDMADRITTSPQDGGETRVLEAIDSKADDTGEASSPNQEGR